MERRWGMPRARRNRRRRASNTCNLMRDHEAALSAVISAFLLLACDGRDSAIKPNRARVDGGTDAFASQEASTAPDLPPASAEHSRDDSGCSADMKDCAGECVSKDACCVDKDCGGVCQRCAENHLCGPAAGDADPNGRCSGACDSGGACKSKQGQGCTSSSASG